MAGVRATLLSVVLVVMLPASALGATYQEAPSLAARVAAGELPPVEERLPLEPYVMEVTESIGRYGGTLRGMSIAPETWDDLQTTMVEGLAVISNDGTEFKPNIAKEWHFSDDYTRLTVHLREGMKWSDGHPVTADDILYWWEDMMLNEEITPVLPRWWRPGGEPMEVIKIDDYTVEFRFAVPYPGAPMIYAAAAPVNILYPKHYLSQFHIKYNPNAQELAKAAGYDHWYQLHALHAAESPTQQVVGRPTIQPWVLVEVDSTHKRFERNPYYWKVDPEGNQLPYIDSVRIEYVGNHEVANLQALSGAVDIAGMEILMENIPLLIQNQSRGNYRVVMMRSTKASDVSLTFNLNHPDPVLREIFQDVRFRRAASLAINRAEINQLLFFGYAEERQATVHPFASYFKQEWADAYAQYDPQEANRLLDEMGLDKRSPDGYRLRPDGEILAFELEFLPHEGPKTSTVELVARYWGDIGIKVTPRARERSFILQRVQTSQHDVTAWHIDRATEYAIWVYNGNKFGPPGDSVNIFAQEWGNWLTSDGRLGEEPPQEMKDLFFALDTITTHAQGSPEYLRLANQAFEIQADQLYLIGTVGLGGWPLVVQDRLKNVVPKDTNETIWFGADNWFLRTLNSPQWYIQE